MKSYSHSRLSSFENCPRQYRFKYIDRETSTLGDTIEAFMGSRVHEALEKLYRDLQMSRPTSLEELLAVYEQVWNKNWEDSVRLVRPEYSAGDWRAKGRKCLEDYWRSYHPFDRDRTIGIERKVELELGPGRKLIGVIDRLSRRKDGVYEIHDYKTSSTLPTQAEVDRDRQLALYQAAVEGMWNDMEGVELVWHYLVFDRELRSRRAAAELESLKEEVNLLIDRIESADDFPPRASALCDWCEFRNLCPLWKHLYRLEELPAQVFREEEGLVLVDRYEAVSREEKKLQAEKEEVKQALIKFGEAFGCEVVFGTDRKIKLKKDISLKFPAAGEARRQELEDLIRRAGQWDDFTQLNLKSLEAALKKGELTPELAGQLKPYYVEEEVVRVYPSNREKEK